MILSHRLKFAFFRVPRTGSQSASRVLVDLGVFDHVHPFWHVQPREVLAEGLMTMDQLREYRCYAFIRDPIERYLSGFRRRLTTEEMRHQPDFFFVDKEQVVEPLDFSNYESELRRMLSEIGVDYDGRIPQLDATQ